MRINSIRFAAAISTFALLAMQPAIAQDGTGANAASTSADATSAPIVTSLRDALVIAYQRDPALLSEQSQLRATDERSAQARAQFGPSLDATVRYGYSSVFVDNTPPFTRRSNGFSGVASLVLSQPLFTSGRLKAGVQAADAQVIFQRQSLRYTESQTLLNVISSYVGVRRSKALLDISNGNLALLDRQFTESDSRFKVREITRTDLDQVVTRVEQGRASVESSRGTLNSSLGQFLNDVGALPGDLEPMPPLAGMPQTLEEAYAASDLRNPLILAAQARERISRAQLKQEQADLGPNVSLQGEAIYGGTGISVFTPDLKQREFRGDVVLQMPIFSSGLKGARIRAARATNDSDWRLIDKAQRDAHQSINSSWNQLVSTRASLSHLQESVAAAQRAYDGAVTQLRSGARTTLDVLDLARDLLNVRASLVSAQSDEYIARASLLAAMGDLEIRNLYPDVERYDPDAHYKPISIRMGVPIIGDAIGSIDGILIGGNSKNRPFRDPATGQTVNGGTALAPEPVSGP